LVRPDADPELVLDAEGDCPAELGPRLLAQASAIRGDVPIAVVVANWEFEAWFLAAAESLRGHKRLGGDIVPPADCESVQDAKKWLRDRMAPGERYGPTSHQASFSGVCELGMARRRAPSFEKLCRDVGRLVDALRVGKG